MPMRPAPITPTLRTPSFSAMQAGGWRDTDRCSPEAGSSSPEAESAPTASIVSVVGELEHESRFRRQFSSAYVSGRDAKRNGFVTVTISWVR